MVSITTIASGGLYRLCSTLEMIVEEWRDESEDAAVVEERRRALEQIAAGGLSSEQILRLARRALHYTPTPPG